MAEVREQIHVSAPAQRVWEAVVDFEARPRWEPRVREARILGGPPLREGSRVRLRVDRDRFTSVVGEMSPPQRLVMLVKGPGFGVRHIYDLEAGSHGVSLTLTGRYGGPIGALVARFMRRSLRRDLTDELQAIKRASEAGEQR